MQTPPLAAILAYQNEDVISRFTDLLAVEQQEARDIFQETKKFLYLSQLMPAFIPDDLLILDEMWHNFILFTRDYQDFCQTYFQKYLHHLPATRQEKVEQARLREQDPQLSKERYLERMEVLLEATYDHLGEETVRKWFQHYPAQYPKARLLALRKV
jgi:DNA polymerase III gamma/tau subunit